MNDTIKPIEMLSVSEAAKRYGVATHALRQWTKPDGQLPCVRAGRKILIATQSIERFLLEGNNHSSPESSQTGNIRRLFG